ncbi:FmdB family zinc ribbon protein [Myxococcota bacterium]
MPIYEYECQKCGEIFEVFQKVSDPPPKRHSCGSRRVRRVMSQTSFILKGTGWYVTDYARKEKGKDHRGREHKESSDNKSSSDGKSSSNDGKSSSDDGKSSSGKSSDSKTSGGKSSSSSSESSAARCNAA